ncbi:hypothetical protein CFO_g2923 [Ceratocystis platani]|uniref:Autophagy-related protein 6 n=1 Tax=Ceratocystis fimbriata f. sp. platani TaxID=88771 RepID=A0A0F8B0Y5_CERFI|nr:hypothetical protein CFO_g2923 [Ceratocystis platani]
MGWLGSLFGSSNNKDDPLKNLDPKLREFLDRESPIKHQKAEAENEFASTKDDAARRRAESAAASAAESQPLAVPRESLFPDGRYAHLWKTYKPLSSIEDEGKTNNEKMADVLDGYKTRKDSIGRAALENCAIQQEEWMQCLKNGSWDDRLMLCRTQVRKFERCYNMQNRFLRTLGYQADPSRGDEFNDAIQVHADALYARMLEHEEAVAAAAAAGQPEPDWKPVVPVVPAPHTSPTGPAVKTEEEQRQWDERLAATPEEERPFEKAAMEADFNVKANTAGRVSKLMEDEGKEVEARRKAGKASLTDHIWALFKSQAVGNEKK